MSSYKIGQISALLSKNKKTKKEGARNKKLEKIFDQTIQKPFAVFLGKKDINDQGPGTFIKKSVTPQSGLVTPETTISEDKNNSSLRKEIEGKQKKGKLEDVETVPGQCSKKQTKLLPVPGLFAVETPSESSAINVENVKVKADNKNKMTKVLSHQEKMDMESCVATQNLQDFPLGKGKKKNKVKSCQKSEGDSDCKAPMKFQRNVQQVEVSEDEEGEDMGDEDTSRSVSIIKRKAASKKKSKRMAKMLSNPEEVDSENCVTGQIPQDSPLKKGKKKLKLKSRQKSADDANSDIAEYPSVVRKRKFSEDSLDYDDYNRQYLDALQANKDEDSSEEMPKDNHEFVPVPKAKLRGFDGREDNAERLRRTLFVGNLPTTADPNRLRIMFKPFGNIESVRIRSAIPPKQTMTKKVANIKMKYHENCYSLNGFVVFSKQGCAEKALSLNGTIVQNHHIRVDLASNKNNHNDECSIFVGNLPFKIDEEKLWSAFAECGTIKSVRVVRDNETGIGKGFGFVLFENEEAVSEALDLNETQVFGRNIRVKIVTNTGKSKNAKKPNTTKGTFIHKKVNVGKTERPEAPRKPWSNKKMAPFDKKSRKKVLKQRRDQKMKKKTALMFAK